ncbi:glycosyltransferase family 4 protein [Pseudalkalibacillus sp. NRS-1564]|uniref:glycosyltransferase family 4 protein n=1 Tax=Pseudalkalibacillus sp. NRS-1564 TaxID=3233900 RepID=UPI003D2E5112
MKFTFQIITLCKGGAQRMLAEMTNGLVDRGHEVIILMPKTGVIEYPIKSTVKRTTELYGIPESSYPKADVIVSNYYTLIEDAENASRNKKGIHIRISLCYEPTFLPEQELSFPSYHVTPNLIVLSKWQQDLIRLNHGITGSIVPVGISDQFYNMGTRLLNKVPNLTAILRRPEGGHSWHREQNYLLEQLAIVQKSYPNAKYTLISPPNELAASKALQMIKASGKYRYLTPADDRELAYHYNEADIFVNSSTYDTASLPGLEAMKCGAALVTTYNGGNLDYCKHGVNSLLSYRYENRLAEDVMTLLSQPNLRKEIALNGEKETEKWTWKRSVDAFLNAVHSIIKTTG